jgi:hypothetical protein
MRGRSREAGRGVGSDREFSRFEDWRFMATDRDSRLDQEHTAPRVMVTSTRTPSRSTVATEAAGEERLRASVTSDNERLRTASGAVPLGTTAGPSSGGGIGSAAPTAAGRSAEDVGAAGDGSRSVR